MSRNKDIAYLHCLTGWDFKICRLIMKEFKWDLRTVERAYILSLDEELREIISKRLILPQTQLLRISQTESSMQSYIIDSSVGFPGMPKLDSEGINWAEYER